MHKIMFDDTFNLTEAVLTGRKTQTRRVMPVSPVDRKYLYDKHWKISGYVAEQFIKTYSRYQVGEIVAIAQNYRIVADYCRQTGNTELLSRLPDESNSGWRNKMLVKPELMPFKIRITNIRIERMKNISEDDCFREGIYPVGKKYAFAEHWGTYFTPRRAFSILIHKVSGQNVWNMNPYIFVYDFELLKN